MLSAKCPECGESVRLPSADLPSDASADCPWCGESVSAAGWLKSLPPVLKVVGADGQPLLWDAPAAQLASASAMPAFGQPLDDTDSDDDVTGPGTPLGHFPGGDQAASQDLQSDPPLSATDNPFAFSNAAVAAFTGGAAGMVAGIAATRGDEQSENDWAEQDSPQAAESHTDDADFSDASVLDLDTGSDSDTLSVLDDVDDASPVTEETIEWSSDPDELSENEELQSFFAEADDEPIAVESDEPPSIDATIADAGQDATLLMDTWDETNPEVANPEVAATGIDDSSDSSADDSPTDDVVAGLESEPLESLEMDSVADEEPMEQADFPIDTPQAKVPVAADQRSYYERNRSSRKQKSPLRQLLAYGLGAGLAIPLAGGILFAMGRLPNVGFWPLDGTYNSSSSRPSRTAAAIPPRLTDDSDTNEPSSPSTRKPSQGRTLVPAESDIATAGKDAMGVASGTSDATSDATIDPDDIGMPEPDLNPKNTDDPDVMTIDLENLVDGSIDDTLGAPTQDTPPADMPDAAESVASNEPAENATDNNEGLAAEPPAENVDNMLLVFPGTTPEPPAEPEAEVIELTMPNPRPDIGSVQTPPSLEITSEPELVESTPDLAEAPKVASSDQPSLDPAVEPASATVEAAKPVIESSDPKKNPPAAPEIATNPAPEIRPPAVTPPAVPSPVVESPEIIQYCDIAEQSIDELAALRSTSTDVSKKDIAKVFVRICRVGELTGATNSNRIRTLLSDLVQIPELDDFASLAGDWMNYSKRPTSGVLLVGRPGSNVNGQTITLPGGSVINVQLPGGKSLPAIDKVIALGNIVDVNGQQRVELISAQSAL
ncbi:hypothetical protein [Stieleria varia]|uniref:Uncharacterized protein n=1 Tax=Stieleria varia TaxID=2528005 RepID=A0A5C6B857_9BACT|nr:hypothetical protein [Stieleria varia]TWU07621.1 hypothetical protein Pla52n_01940 [Stieleria varia]